MIHMETCLRKVVLSNTQEEYLTATPDTLMITDTLRHPAAGRSISISLFWTRTTGSLNTIERSFGAGASWH